MLDTDIKRTAAEPDGSVLACATLFPAGRRQPSQIALAHFTSSGALDTTFGSGGSVIANPPGGCSALALLSNGNILVLDGQAVAEYTSRGNVLSTITAATIVASDPGGAPGSASNVFQPNGDYLYAFDLFVGEESRGHDSSVEVQRFTETGSPDATFANPSFHFILPGGPEIQAVVQGLTVAPNGDIVVVGGQTHFTQSGPIISNGLARLTPAGGLDSTFGNGGLFANVPPTDAGFGAVIVQPDGNIVTAGVGGGELVVSRFLGKQASAATQGIGGNSPLSGGMRGESQLNDRVPAGLTICYSISRCCDREINGGW